MKFIKNKIGVRFLINAVSVALTSGAFMSGFAYGATDLPDLTIGYFKGPNPETIGQKYDLFGKNIHFSSVESGVTAFQEILGGSMQLAGGIGAPPLALALLKSMPLKVIYVPYTFNQSLIVDASIKSPNDLVGKTIAVTTGTTGDQSFSDFLERHGLNPKSVKTVNMAGAAMLGAFKRGDIAGGYIWDPIESEMLRAGGHAMDSTNPFAAVVASAAVIKDHPGAIQAYICSLAKANDFIRDKHSESVSAVATLLNGDHATAEQVFKTRTFLSSNEVMQNWMGNNAARLTDNIKTMLTWANQKSPMPVAQVPDAHAIVDATFANAALHGACQ